MTTPSAIVGVAQTCHGDLSDRSFEELVFQVCSAALADAGLGARDVDLVVGASIDLLDGTGISNAALIGPSAARLKEEVKVEEDGLVALQVADQRLRSGRFEVALVYAHAKGTGVDLEAYGRLLFDPVALRPLPLTEDVALALQADAYARRRGMTDEDAGRIRALAEAALVAGHVRPGPAVDPGLTPFARGDRPPPTDGACALVVVRGDRAAGFAHAALLAGTGLCVDAYGLGERDLAEVASARRAAAEAYRRAGIADPAREIDVAEVSAPSSWHLPMLVEALGVSEDAIAELRTGRLAGRVNPSGGALLADPRVATGLVRVAEAALQLSGRAAGRQVDGARIAVAHGASGVALQSNAVAVLRRAA